MNAQASTIDPVAGCDQLLLDGQVQGPIAFHGQLRFHLGDMAPHITEVLIILRSAHLMIGLAHDIHQVAGKFGIHGDTPRQVFNHTRASELQRWEGGDFVCLPISPPQMSVHIHAVFS